MGDSLGFHLLSPLEAEGFLSLDTFDVKGGNSCFDRAIFLLLFSFLRFDVRAARPRMAVGTMESPIFEQRLARYGTSSHQRLPEDPFGHEDSEQDEEGR